MREPSLEARFRPVAGASRIAFFGGSFDPPHLGHLRVARAARAALNLDAVLFAPVGSQPLKPHGITAGFEDRLAMTRLAIAREPGFAVSLVDAPKASGDPNFTLDTLKRLRAEVPMDGALFCLMGADSFFSLRRWRGSVEIPFLAPLIVASRPGQRLGQRIAVLRAALPSGLTIESLPAAGESGSGAEVRSYIVENSAGMSAPFYLLLGLHEEISASQIRDRIRQEAQMGSTGRADRRELLPNSVSDYIRSHGLYL